MSTLCSVNTSVHSLTYPQCVALPECSAVKNPRRSAATAAAEAAALLMTILLLRGHLPQVSRLSWVGLQCTLPHTPAVRRTARMQCGQKSQKIGSNSSSRGSSSSDGDFSLVPAAASFHEGISFIASNSAIAKEKFVHLFKAAHLDGHINCINSRPDYVYCKCKRCNCTAAVKLDKQNSKKWIVSKVHEMATQPCTLVGSIVATDLSHPPAISTLLPDISIPSPSFVKSECCICHDSFDHDKVFKCPNPAAHLFCECCFELNVSSQFGEDLGAFLKRNCAIICKLCACEARNQETISFNMQALMPR